MALSGVHVAFGYVGDDGAGQTEVGLRRPAVVSEPLMTGTAVQTVAMAPGGDSKWGNPQCRIATSIDIFYAVGSSPNSTTGPRDFLFAGSDVDVFCNPGDKVAWTAA